MTNEEILDRIRQRFPTAVVDAPEGMKDFTVTLAADQILAVATFLRDELGFDYLTDVTAVDYRDRFEVVYHLYSVSQKSGLLVIKVNLADRERPEVDSVTPVWAGAHLMECEAYDLMGIQFKGHPQLRRIMMWDGFPGHPLRKDFENRTYTFKELEPTRPKPPNW